MPNQQTYNHPDQLAFIHHPDYTEVTELCYLADTLKVGKHAITIAEHNYTYLDYVAYKVGHKDYIVYYNESNELYEMYSFEQDKETENKYYDAKYLDHLNSELDYHY